ncbi:c-type cytochrome [Rhodobacter ferrooxidans]|uniref:Cytochrome c class I n=1 Tax=Rhodobacter ferrooxidans TaxID=371731 RepID=C8S0F4_9RHOB|nr:c-type cytochrome [Rhodobacter sp. SW2]EEW25488.1 cytochrome c class I [Rhodobacter sp. SW2]
MTHSFYAALAVLAMAVPASAGDIAEGEEIFTKCMTCHSIIAPDGTAIKKGGAVGPNLYGVIGRQAGTYPGFAYSKSMKAAGEAGIIWSADQIAIYVQSPPDFLKKATNDPKAKAKMAFKLSEGGDDVAAFVASASPAAVN